MHTFFVTCAKGLEEVVARELNGLGVEQVKIAPAVVSFNGELVQGYRACLWSRCANRVLLALATADESPFIDRREDLYQHILQMPWEHHVKPDGATVVHFSVSNAAINNTQFGAMCVKDAVVDRFNQYFGTRPSVDKLNPDLRVHVHLAKNRVAVSIDLTGESLHRRGYRSEQGEAPLRETLAAGLLLRAGWPATAEIGGALVDPMCGSGTLVIEAAMIAADFAPGLLREEFGFHRWLGHNQQAWQLLVDEALARRERAIAQIRPLFFGYDNDARILRVAERNAERAGFAAYIRFAEYSVQALPAPSSGQGLMICNPPYGERLGEVEALRETYLELAHSVKAKYAGWTLAVFTGNEDLAREMRLRPDRRYKLFNGAIPSQLLLYSIVSSDQARLREDGAGEISDTAQMVANRLIKNQKRLAPWLARAQTDCYRVYDADLPEYSAAIDIYGDQIHVQEYAPPKTVDPQKAQKRLRELLQATASVFEVPVESIAVKTRRQNKGKSQYERQTPGGSAPLHKVREGRALFYVNLRDYLDTGLFLDHRPLRLRIGKEARGKRFLNLFCYTATATVHAALGGAAASTSVDMSHTYLAWAERNFELNRISTARHVLVQADCFKWLDQCREGFDLILLDPPTFSNSKRMDDVLDVQRDHVALITRCMDLLRPGGRLYFSNNLRSFKLDAEALARYKVEDITRATLDPDFARNPKIHHCFVLEHRQTVHEKALRS